jgi:ABC-type multidrug transport system fused ATPase/permease subunit
MAKKITQNTTRLLFIRVITILVLLSGLWWLLWLIIWGNNYSSFGAGLEFTLFFIAEFINYILGIVYNFNFWNSIRRKWKSLDRLNPPFNEELIANILISHYSEAAADTERTIYGSLRLKVTEKTVLKVWICDDGFWKPIPQEKPKTLMSTQNKPSFFQKIKSFFSKKKTEEVKAPLLEKSEKVEEGDEKKEKTKKFEEIDKILEGKKEVKEDEKDEELKKEEEKDEELKKEEEKELTDKEKEEKILKYIAER